MNDIHPLPVVPPRWPDEACGSWITRVADVYGLGAHRLIDYAIGYDPTMQQLPLNATIESLMPALPIEALAQLLRLENRVSMVSTLITAPRGWVIEDPADTPICPLCWTNDIAKGQTPYPRNSWFQAWRVICAVHGCLLDSLCAMNTKRRKQKPPFKLVTLSTRIPAAKILRRPLRGRYPTPKLHIVTALRAIAEMETVIGQSLGGVAPNPKRWGPVDAAGFVTVVRDVTTFLLSNFTERPRPSLASFNLHRVADPGPVRCFASHPRYIRTRKHNADATTTLTSIADPAVRRAALFWARELMHFSSMQRWIPLINRIARVKRQAAILRRQTSDGLAWLIDRSHDWPADYRKSWWRDFAIVAIP